MPSKIGAKLSLDGEKRPYTRMSKLDESVRPRTWLDDFISLSRPEVGELLAVIPSEERHACLAHWQMLQSYKAKTYIDLHGQIRSGHGATIPAGFYWQWRNPAERWLRMGEVERERIAREIAEREEARVGQIDAQARKSSLQDW